MKKPKKKRDWLFEVELRRVEQAANFEAFERRMLEARAHVEAVHAKHLEKMKRVHARLRAARLLAEELRLKRGPKNFRSKRPPWEEGGEPIPAIPRPKPTPLSGGAAAPLEFEDRKPRPARPALSVPGFDGDKSGRDAMTRVVGR